MFSKNFLVVRESIENKHVLFRHKIHFIKAVIFYIDFLENYLLKGHVNYLVLIKVAKVKVPAVYDISGKIVFLKGQEVLKNILLLLQDVVKTVKNYIIVKRVDN